MHDAPNASRFACLGQRPDQLDMDPAEPSRVPVQDGDQIDYRVLAFDKLREWAGSWTSALTSSTDGGIPSCIAFDKLRVGTLILGGWLEAIIIAHKLRPTKPVPPSMRMSCMRAHWRRLPTETCPRPADTTASWGLPGASPSARARPAPTPFGCQPVVARLDTIRLVRGVDRAALRYPVDSVTAEDPAVAQLNLRRCSRAC